MDTSVLLQSLAGYYSLALVLSPGVAIHEVCVLCRSSETLWASRSTVV